MNEHDTSTCGSTDQNEGLFRLMGQVFRGRLGWTAVISYIYIALFAALAIFAAVRFFAADQTQPQILWATVFAVSWCTIMMLKLWLWILMIRASAFNRLDRMEKRLTEQGGRAGE